MCFLLFFVFFTQYWYLVLVESCFFHIATVIILLLLKSVMHYALPVCLHARERGGITEASRWEEGVESKACRWEEGVESQRKVVRRKGWNHRGRSGRSRITEAGVDWVESKAGG